MANIKTLKHGAQGESKTYCGLTWDEFSDFEVADRWDDVDCVACREAKGYKTSDKVKKTQAHLLIVDALAQLRQAEKLVRSCNEYKMPELADALEATEFASRESF